MKIGYARVSTYEQNEALQLDALEKAGIEKCFTDKISGTKIDRKGLDEALVFAREGDVFVVWKLDRLGRSLKHLIGFLNDLQERGIEFISLTEHIDTTTPMGKFLFHVMGALAEFERDLIKERTLAGLAAARARGRVGGRPRTLNTKQVALLQSLYNDKDNDIEDICESMHISRATLFRYVGQPEKPVQAS